MSAQLRVNLPFGKQDPSLEKSPVGEAAAVWGGGPPESGGSRTQKKNGQQLLIAAACCTTKYPNCAMNSADFLFKIAEAGRSRWLPACVIYTQASEQN